MDTTKNSPEVVMSRGIMHGPYLDMPYTELAHYVGRRITYNLDLHVNDEQYITDRRTEWQYDKHSEAVEDALEAGRISAEHAIQMYDKVLRPWFIFRRNPGE